MPGRRVGFHTKEKDVREFDDADLHDYMRDVERVTDTLVQFLGRTVKENIYHLGQHYRGHDNDDNSYADIFEKKYKKISEKVLQNDAEKELEGVYETMLDYVDKPTSHLLRTLFKMQSHKTSNTANATREYKRLHWCAMIVMLIGLGSFLEYGHCMNKCADALIYLKDRNEVWFSHWGTTVPEFANMCSSSHGAIEDALGWDDIRDMDRLLQETSAIARKGAKVCSLAFPTDDVAKHAVAPLSGMKNRIVATNLQNGTTVYTTRRGAKYTMTPSGLLTKI